MTQVPRIRRRSRASDIVAPTGSETVTVKFLLDGDGNASFAFSTPHNSSGDVDMAPGTDTITFTLDSASTAGYNLHKVHFSPDDRNVFSQEKSGSDIVVTDNDTLGETDDPVEYCYSVTVKRHDHSAKYTSDDPKIINDPPAKPPL